MSTSKHMDKICVAAISLALIVTILFMNGGAMGLWYADRMMGYECRLFDDATVHTLDIVMDDWDGFIETCENEEYTACTVIIDGESFKNVGLRAKGNTSLRNVQQQDSIRYSLKIEFGHYQSQKSYHGLDKLCLNNLIQDNTMMKDYLVYRMMADFGVHAPLCSFVYVTVNGAEHGLFLAVEGIEDSFLQRSYGKETGELYKPDSTDFGGGRGNGMNFDTKEFQPAEKTNGQGEDESTLEPSARSARFAPREQRETSEREGLREMAPPEMMPDRENDRPPDFSENGQPNEPPELPNTEAAFSEMPSGDRKAQTDPENRNGMGKADVKLQYIDDNSDSYPNIFENAKTDITNADKVRLIESLKKLSTYSDLDDVLDTDAVLRYFVVHNFVCNGDSYTGSMIHNYYLHEKDGKLSMLPWDYNLAFGTFQGGSAESAVNASIDEPVSGGSADDRPMVGWIFSTDSYTSSYHELFRSFIERWFSNGELVEMIKKTAALLRPYVEKDPTKFCTTEEFDTGIRTLQAFVDLRAQAVRLQLSGDNAVVETNGLQLSDMGTMGNKTPMKKD